MSAIIPIPRIQLQVRQATMADIPFIDALQKRHSRQVGFMHEKTLCGKVEAGHVIIAEEGQGARSEGQENADSSLAPRPSPLAPVPAGYVIGTDKYLKREELGVIYQLNVVPTMQRGLIGATLVQAMFERAAWGCKLFCLWCAQDIEANHFWESIGFVPIAFRAGSEKKRRIHIYWCKRIREGDTATPMWFPSQTSGGSMMEDRLVFPIPPGTHWSDAKPIVLPRHTQPRQLENADARPRKIKPKGKIIIKLEPLSGGLTFASPQSPQVSVKVEKPRQKRPKIKNDPKFVSAARELRDRWLEHVNNNEHALPEPAGKYEVCRQIEATRANQKPVQLLN